MTRKKVLVLLGSIWLALVLAVPMVASCAGPTPTPTPTPTVEQVNWKISQPYPEGNVLYELTEDFIARVEEASGGTFTFTHYPGELLGDYIAVQESVKKGDVEMCETYPVDGVFGPPMNVFFLGWLFSTEEEAIDANVPGGWFFEDILQPIYLDNNVRAIGGLTAGFCNVLSNVKIDDIFSCEPNHIKLRVPKSEMWVARYEGLGFDTVPMPMSEVATAMKLGTIDGSGGRTMEEAWNERDTFKYLYHLRVMECPLQSIANLDAYNKLSAEHQQVLEQVGKEWTRQAWEKCHQCYHDYGPQLEDYGIEIFPNPTTEQWKHMASIVRPAEWAVIEKYLSEDMMNILRQHAK